MFVSLKEISTNKPLSIQMLLSKAKTFKDAGIQFIHVVDLDGALDGRATNRDLIANVKKVSGLGIEVGGGIRTLEQIRDYLEVGIDRIIIGSMAVKNPDFVRAALVGIWCR